MCRVKTPHRRRVALGYGEEVVGAAVYGPQDDDADDGVLGDGARGPPGVLPVHLWGWAHHFRALGSKY